jgi:Pyruvate/2-oxoacid:ferredoxin oxidoreductase delta subunit
MKRSTWNIIRRNGWRVDRTIHAWIYFTYYDRYVRLLLGSGRVLERWFKRFGLTGLAFREVFQRYHGKVLSLEDATRILRMDHDLVLGPEETKRIIPYHHANKVILQEPDYIVVMDCPCRMASEHPCEPIDVCMAVGKPIAEFWLEHGKKFHARKISADEAIELLKRLRAQGCVTNAWFKDCTDGFYAFCNCCTCCCGSLESMRIVRQLKGAERIPPMITPSGYVVRVDEEKCVACGGCAGICPFGASVVEEDGRVSYHLELCMGGGICVDNCPQGARTLVRDPGRLEPLDVEAMASGRH